MHVDKNPHYNLTIPVMIRLFPQTRLLIALRDPRDVLLSCFLTYLPLNPVSVQFLTLSRLVERYLLDMRAWLKFRELVPCAWAEVRYEDLVANVETAVKPVIVETLGLEWKPEILDFRDQLTGKAVSSPTYHDVKQPIYTRSIGRWKNYWKHLEPAMERLEPLVREFGYEC